MQLSLVAACKIAESVHSTKAMFPLLDLSVDGLHFENSDGCVCVVMRQGNAEYTPTGTTWIDSGPT